MPLDLQQELARAVQVFWQTRGRQGKRQGAGGRGRDKGNRTAVTGGAQMDGFVELVHALLRECGLPEETIFHKRTGAGVVLPGFFRPTKEWDLLVTHDKQLLATVEFKSHIGPSFGNNYNNRTEEAVGSSHDLWTAYREGAFERSPQPWLGYLMLLEEAHGSTSPVDVKEPHFPVFAEFRGASYATRYGILCRRLVRERMYDAACLILSERKSGLRGGYREPAPDLTFERFCASLVGRAKAYGSIWRIKESGQQYKLF
jgi:hypothetical protein